jgi:mono/diheme cytochrome c family protein
MRCAIAVSALIGLALAGACSSSDKQAGGPIPAPAPKEKDFRQPREDPAATPTPASADTIFATRCSTCHGPDGKGNGPASAALNPKPRDYTDPVWQKSVTDEQIKKTIVGGGAAVGKSPLMVPNPDLAGQEVILDGLVKIVRGFAPHQ